MGVLATRKVMKLCTATILALALTACTESETGAGAPTAQSDPAKQTESVADQAPLFTQSTVIIQSGDNQHQFDIELAATPPARQRGLMFRQSMAADAGMLFAFEQDRHIVMWMKNTFIPLDMLFISADGAIVSIAADTTPHSTVRLQSGGVVRAVLELNAGTAKRRGIKAGNIVRHEIFGNITAP